MRLLRAVGRGGPGAPGARHPTGRPFAAKLPGGMLPRRLTFASLAVFIGTAGYYAIGRGTWTFVDCLCPPPDHVLAGGATLIVLGDPEHVRQLSAEAAAGRVAMGRTP